MAIAILGIAAGAWGVIMAISPALQIKQMLRTRSSEDVSLGYFAVLLPGFALWVAYGVARGDLAIMIPNVVAVLVGGATLALATYFRNPSRRRAQQPPEPLPHSTQRTARRG